MARIDLGVDKIVVLLDSIIPATTSLKTAG